jgi:membrane protein
MAFLGKFKFKDLPKLLKESAIYWNDDGPWRLSAVVAYYAILSLPGLLVIIINSVGAIWGAEIVQGKVTSEISGVIGSEAAKAVQGIIENARYGDRSTIATILGIAVLIFGATGVFYHLQLSLNEVWSIKQDPKRGIVRFLLDRVIGFGFVLIVGFLLLVSFVISAGLSAFSELIRANFPDFTLYLAHALDIVLSIGVISVLFALIYKFLPDAKIEWRTVWVGAIITSILFTLGKELLGLYFGQADPASTYGAAGSIVLILLWVSYSCLILFFGAEFTFVFGKHYGHGIKPKKHAVQVEEKEVVVKEGED